MCSTTSTIALCLPSKIPLVLRHRLNFSFSTKPQYFRPRKPSDFLSASVIEKNSAREISWISCDKMVLDDYNGWAIAEYPPEPAKKKGLPTFVVFGVGASLAAAIGLLAYFSLSKKGFVFHLNSPFSVLHGFSVNYSATSDDAIIEGATSNVLCEESNLPIENIVLDSSMATDKSFRAMKEHKFERIIVPFAVDAAQQEALLALKALKIVEDDVRADELCTRREYARWLVRANSHLERSRKHRLNISSALSASTITAFDDVGIDDPDFESIQSLAETGVVRSKLSDGTSCSNSNVGGEEGFTFLPERFVSRQDLIGWKAKIEYQSMPDFNEEVARKKIGFLDAKDISSYVLADVFVDVAADEKCTTKRVFGQSKRLQPSKPCTKGQAAVALTSGRMTDLIHTNISRLEADYISKQTEMNELRAELIARGDIKRHWETKMAEEKSLGSEVETIYRDVVDASEREKMCRENAVAEMSREKAALDCQEKLLSALKDEIADMSGRLRVERVKHFAERVEVHDAGRRLEAKLEGFVDKRSILEAEVEALKILRSWIEEEARKNEARAKLLEEAGRRWKWDGPSH